VRIGYLSRYACFNLYFSYGGGAVNAIYIKFHDATRTKPRRIIASMIDDNRIISKVLKLEWELPCVFKIDALVENLVYRFIFNNGFSHLKPVIGKLPNGDYCATLSEAGL
jgi:hypothetical protein